MSRAAVLPALGLLLGSCGGVAPEGRAALHAAVAGPGTIRWHAPEGVLAQRARVLAADFEPRRSPRRTRRGPEAGGEQPPTVGRVLLGTFDDPAVRRLAERAGVRFPAGGGFDVFGHHHDDATDTLLATFADPDSGTGGPLVLYAGWSAEAVARRATSVPAPWFPRLRTWSAGGPGVALELEPDGRPRTRTFVDRAPDRRRRWAGGRRLEREGVVLVTPPGADRARASSYGRQCERAAERVRTWLDAELEQPIEVLVYADAEDFERELGEARLVHVDRASLRVHALLAEGVPDDGGAGVARATALALRGEPAEAWLEDALAVAAAQSWWGRSLHDWMARLRADELLPSVEEILDPRGADTVSVHRLLPARGRIALRREVQEGGLLRAWMGEELLRFGQHALFGRELDDEERARRERFRREALAEVPRGAALYGPVPTGLRSAYASRSVSRSLAELRALGANAFSVDVLAAELTLDPVLVPEPRAVHATSSDAALASVVAAGRREGMSAMLVLQPLFAPWSTWGDGVSFAETDDLRSFFLAFQRIGTHYGLLAELLGVEHLCLGAGLATASNTAKVQAESHWIKRARHARRQGWHMVARRVARVFDGTLTYAARSTLEARRVYHWDSLDAVGLLGFRTLGSGRYMPGPARVRQVLEEELAAIAQVGHIWNRPVRFVQLGIAAREGAWTEPEAPLGAPRSDVHPRWFAGLIAALDDPARDGVGLYLWNWNIEPWAGGPGGFSPRGEVGEALFAELLGP